MSAQGDRARGASSDWHAAPALLAAYAAGRAGDADAWSLEAHLTSCSLCQAELAVAVRTSAQQRPREQLEQARARLLASLPAQPAPSAAPLRWAGRGHAAWLVRPAALGAVAIAVLAAVALSAAAHLLPTVSAPQTGALLWLLAPMIPLAGVALCSGADDPMREMVLSTPSAGLRVVLWRTALVLAVALPSAAGAGTLLQAVGIAAAGGSWPVVWLLPCLGLTAATLAVGTVVGLYRAAAAVAGLWCLVVLVPALLTAHTAGTTALRSLVQSLQAPADVPVLDGAAAQLTWLLVAAAGMAVVAVRRAEFERLSVVERRNGR